MKPTIKTLLVVSTAILSAGCSHNQALRSEIASIETRLASVESEITEGTAQIGGEGKDIRTRLAYRPLQSWAENFGTRTATFRQTSRSGDLARQSTRCRVFGRKRAGYRVWIHEDESTKVDFSMGPLAVIPDEDGLQFRSGFVVIARSQIAAAGRPPCIGGWSPTVSVGVRGISRPSAEVALRLAQADGLDPRYELVLVAPDEVDVELRTGIKVPHIGDIDIRRTVTFDGFPRNLADGELDLIAQETLNIEMPDGEIRTYRIATIDPTLRTDGSAITLESDIEIDRETN